MKRYSAPFLLVMLLAGCAQPLWFKPNATQGEFERDRYACLQQSQQRVSGAQVSQFGGSASSSMATNQDLLSSCLRSKGWSLQTRESVDSLMVEAVNSRERYMANIAANCRREDLRLYYAKSACQANQMTLAHLTDETRITPEEREVLLKQRAQVLVLNSEFDAIQRRLGATESKVAVTERTYTRPENDKNNADLYSGKITWGEYNQRRRDIAL